MALRVELADPGDEGEALLRALRRAGLAAEPVRLEEVGRSGPAVLVVATDSPEGAEAARAAAARRGVTVVALGPPPDGVACRHLPRPVDPERLAALVRDLVHGGEATVATSEHALTAAPVERTIQLGEGTAAEWHAPADGAASEAPATDRPSRPPPQGRPPCCAQLARLYREADRRIFPEEPPMELLLPVDELPPEELVPDEVMLAPPLEDAGPLPEEAEGLTFVLSLPPADEEASDATPVALEPTAISQERSLPEAAGRRAASSPPPVSSPPASEPPPQPATAPSLPRSEHLEGVALLARLWRLARKGADATVQVDYVSPRGEPRSLRLVLGQGAVASVGGPVASDVARQAWERGWLPAPPDPGDEEAARAALHEAREAGKVPATWLGAALRRRRDALIEELGAAADLEGTVRRGTGGAAAPPLPPVLGTLPELLARGARRWLSGADLASRLGRPLDRAGLHPTAAFRGCVEAAHVEPELAATLIDRREASVAELLGATPPGAGMAGLLWALHAAGALRLEELREPGARRTRSATDAEAARAALLQLVWRARRSPHHRLLRVEPGAPASRVRAALEEARAELEALAAGARDPGLEALRGEILDALEEAARVLGDPGLAEAYLRALGETPAAGFAGAEGQP